MPTHQDFSAERDSADRLSVLKGAMELVNDVFGLDHIFKHGLEFGDGVVATLHL